MAPLARDVIWLPAVENRGEGVFLGFKKERIDEWLKRKAVLDRARQLAEGFGCWCEEHPKSGRQFVGAPYIMLHSLSHLLITALALECGYPSSSIRERVYAGESGYGILLYTGSADAEGTMGGLVEAGKQIERHLKAALYMAGLCSNDPVCRRARPEQPSRAPIPPRSSVPRLPAHRRDFLRAVQRPSRPGAGGGDGGQSGGGILQAVTAMSTEFQHLTSSSLRASRCRPAHRPPVSCLQRGGVARLLPWRRPHGDCRPNAAIGRRRTAPPHLALLLDTIAQTRACEAPEGKGVDLVWSGPVAKGLPNRDTGSVVRELFHSATDEVLLAGYAIHQGRDVFRALAERMDAEPALRVRMFLDIQRNLGDTSPAPVLLSEFVRRFRTKEWPGNRLPEVFHDPRSLAVDAVKRSSLHAKCVVVDRRVAFVSSANFTEAAQERNIEVGVLIRSPRFAEPLAERFEVLAVQGVLLPLSFEAIETR